MNSREKQIAAGASPRHRADSLRASRKRGRVNRRGGPRNGHACGLVRCTWTCAPPCETTQAGDRCVTVPLYRRWQELSRGQARSRAVRNRPSPKIWRPQRRAAEDERRFRSVEVVPAACRMPGTARCSACNNATGRLCCRAPSGRLAGDPTETDVLRQDPLQDGRPVRAGGSPNHERLSMDGPRRPGESGALLL